MLSMSQFVNDEDFHWAVRQENKRFRAALEKVVDIAEGRDQLDGFPRNVSERLRRLSACADTARAALK